MDKRALAIANNDIVYLWWTYPKKIPGCLGFSVRRIQEGRNPVPLPASVGFDSGGLEDLPKQQRNTDYYPVQAYQWKDLFVPEEAEVSYEIVPVTGTPKQKLTDMPGLAVYTNKVKATDTIGKHRVVFNRGIISTQSLTRQLPGNKRSSLEKRINQIGDEIRGRLAGEAIGALTSLLERALTQGGKCYCALYELTDPELIDALIKAKGSVEVILSNADGSETVEGKQRKIYDGTNLETREKLHRVLGESFHDRLLAKGNFIGHNKFVVYVDGSGNPKAVMTGSTNWTTTGLCTQSNNILIIEDGDVASKYLDYWQRLLSDQAEQGADLRQDNAKAPSDICIGPGNCSVRIWFSPNMPVKRKPAKDPAMPPDMAEVFQAIEDAQYGVLFLLFSAGAPSILQKLSEVSADRADKGKPFFVRGAISDSTAAEQFATCVYKDTMRKPNKVITGVAGIEDTFSYWEKELARYRIAVIHDKLLVVDPFTDDCVVVTGSHNLGYKASYCNDENLCIIRGNRAIAEVYAVHVLDIVSHYTWRYRMAQDKKKNRDVQTVFSNLNRADDWQDWYFEGDVLRSRDLFFFPA